MNTENSPLVKGVENDDLSGGKVGSYLVSVFLLIYILIWINNAIHDNSRYTNIQTVYLQTVDMQNRYTIYIYIYKHMHIIRIN